MVITLLIHHMSTLNHQNTISYAAVILVFTHCTGFITRFVHININPARWIKD